MTTPSLHYISDSLLSGRILEAISSIRANIDGMNYLYTQQLDELESLYKQAIGYRVQGIVDPEYPRIYQRIVSSLFKLAQTIEQEQLLPQSYHLYHSNYRQYWLAHTAPSVEQLLLDSRGVIDRVAYDKQMLSLFGKIWSARTLTEQEQVALATTSTDTYRSCVIASALTLSLLEFWSEDKFLLLLRLLEHKSLQVQIRVVVGLVICIANHHASIKLSSSSLSLAWEGALQAYPQLTNYIREAMLGLYRVQEAEELGRKVQRDLSSSWEKLSPEVKQRMSKLGTKEIDKQLDEDETPEWLEELRQSSMAKRIQQVGQLQASGMDIMFGSFVHLKQHSFFREVMNWFIPLDFQHSVLGSLTTIRQLDIESLSSIGISLCDSDAYSLLLSLSSLPYEMQTSIIDSIGQLPESAEKKHSSTDKMRQELKSYIEGVYRFYKLFERRSEFEDIFAEVLDFTTLPLLSPLLKNSQMLHSLGNIQLQQEHYHNATITYQLLRTIEPLDSLSCEKLGWSYIQLGQWEKALEAYKMADLIVGDNPFIYKQMAECAKQLHRYREAIEYYDQCAKHSTEEAISGDIFLKQASCYIALGDFSSALSLGYRYQLTRQPGLASMRIVAYCLFVQGIYDEAQDYYRKIILTNEHNGTDLLQYAHTELLQGRYTESLELYRRANSMLGKDKLLELWLEDKELLLRLGLEQDYFVAMSEYIQIP